MVTFGLSGGIASGKSTVTKTFRQNGILMVDADIIAREVVRPGQPGWDRIIATFGGAFLNPDRTLDRVKFGAFIFKDQQARKLLDSLMLPLISGEANKQIAALHKEGHPIVGYDAALLLESGHAHLYRPLVVVVCPEETQISRLMSRNNLTRQEAQQRIEAQMPADQKALMADYVIDSSGTVQESVNQTVNIIKELRELDIAQRKAK